MKYDHNGNPTMTQDGLSMEERISMLANIMVLQSRVIKHQTLILSEHYKKRDVKSKGKQITDENKLNHEFGVMNRYIEHMQDIKDNLCD